VKEMQQQNKALVLTRRTNIIAQKK